MWSLGRNGKGRPEGSQDVEDPVAQLYWRPDGGGLAALDAQGGVTVWRIEPAKGRKNRARAGQRNGSGRG